MSDYIYIDEVVSPRAPLFADSSLKCYKLDEEQFNHTDGLLELWGAWVHSGRITVKASSIIYELMLKAGTAKTETRAMCSDEMGEIISNAVDSALKIDKVALAMVISYYAYGASKHSIIKRYHRYEKPQRMKTRGKNRLKKPSLSTCRDRVNDILDFSLYLIYFELKKRGL